MTKEILIRAATVSPELTRAASAMILEQFGGYFRTDGTGGYTFYDGQMIEEPSIEWRIRTTAKDLEIYTFFSQFAESYCHAGNQQSVYMEDAEGCAYLGYSNGAFTLLEDLGETTLSYLLPVTVWILTDQPQTRNPLYAHDHHRSIPRKVC